MIVSDSPPWWPGTQREYEFAVSIRFPPAATNASRRLKDVGSSAVQPNTLPPNANGATAKPVRPSLHRCMMVHLHVYGVESLQRPALLCPIRATRALPIRLVARL